MFAQQTWSKTILTAAGAALLLAVGPLAAGFAGTDVFIPASARAAGVAPSQFYSTLWITNLSTAAAANVQLKFFQRDTSNTSPITVPVTVAPGETKKYENVVQTVFGLPSGSGAIRIQSDREVLASSRTYNLPPGADIRDANGLFFTGIPQSLAIANGESSQLQGVSQNGSEDFRYNFGFVETAGAPSTVRIIVRNADGSVAGTKDYPVLAFEAKQFAVTDAAPSVATINGRIDASVVSGAGAVLLYATSVANGSQDSIGFEMSYKSSILSGGVTSLNGLLGAVNLAAGSNVTLTPSGNTITVSATGGGGVAGVSSVNGYVGAVTIEAGTNASFAPASAGNGIRINASGGASGVTTLNSLSGAVSLVNGSGISVTPSGNNLTIAATGAGLTLPYTGSAATGAGASAFNVSTPGTAGFSSAVLGTISSTSPAGFATAVVGSNAGTGANGIGVWGGQQGSGFGVLGTTSTGWGVFGSTSTGPGPSGAYGVVGQQGTSGTYDTNRRGGVWGDSHDGQGVLGTSYSQPGVAGLSVGFTGVQGMTLGTGTGSRGIVGVGAGTGSLAAYFSGPVQVSGTLSKGGGSFKIDHPLDPENKYLYHSFVESPDMMNIYNGIVSLDATGEAMVLLPDWFSALNRDYRYQLTCVGGYAPVYVSREVENNQFRIAGGKPGLKVSWQVTGIRKDAFANANRIPVEEMKSDVEKGHFLYPEALGQPEEKGIEWARDPERMKELKALRDRVAAESSAR